MSCTCRVTPLRIFIQGLRQVHKIENTPSLLRLQSPLFTLSVRHDGFALTQQTRLLHASRFQNQEASPDTPAPSTPKSEPDSSASPSIDKTVPRTKQSKNVAPRKTFGRPRSSKHFNASKPPMKKKHTPSSSSTDRKPRSFQPRLYNDSKNTKFERKDDDKRFPEDQPFQAGKMKFPAGYHPGKEFTWRAQRAALKEKFPEGWKPQKRLSPDALEGIRALNAQFPDVYDTPALARKFEVSPEAIRRILRSKWQPTVAEEKDRIKRWERRGKSVWERKAALGIKPPKKWREEGIARDPSFHVQRQGAIQKNREAEERDHREIFGKRPNTRGGSRRE